MIENGLIKEKREDVGKNHKRKVKVYGLTFQGRNEAKALRKKNAERRYRDKDIE